MIVPYATMKTPKRRLDQLLVDRGLAETRARAQALILGGKVRSGTQVLDKAGKEFPADLPLEIETPPRFVSRGGEKLDGFLQQFPVGVEGQPVLDVGASTGGFTDCLLQRGASHATCVDVGHGQLHYKLQKDPRVVNLEKVNARALDTVALPHPRYAAVVMDLSFISLTKVLPAVWPRVAPGGALIALVKPQFEAEKHEADAGQGIIRDPAIHARVLEQVRRFAREQLPGAHEFGCCESPIKGGDGNIEFLVGWKAQA